MSVVAAISNPLAINLQRQLSLLLPHIPSDTTDYLALTKSTSTPQLLSALSSLLAKPAFTKLVATLFRPLLLDLCSRWLDDDVHAEEHLFALSSLLEVHTELFTVLNRLLAENFQKSPLSFLTGTIAPNSIDTTRVQRLLLAYYRILRANVELPSQLSWSLTHLSALMWSPYLDNGVRLLAIRVYAMQSGMGEEERLKVEREVLGELCGVDCDLYYGTSVDGTENRVDGWILPAIETTRVRDERNEIVTTEMDYYSVGEGEVPMVISESDLSPHVVNIHGVLLLRSSLNPSADSSFIPLASSIEALRHLALNVSLTLPTLLTSAPSAGKALLLSHLASLLHSNTPNQIITIHLADTSLDPRSLLGSYVSSTTNPGTFEWKEGVLVRAMREGKWVVFEDIDRGSNEVLGVIKPLVESLGANKWIGGRAQLTVPSRGVVVAHTDFLLFATRSILPAKSGFHSPTFFGSHRFFEVQLRSPSTPELRNIVDAKFPRLAGSPANAAIDLWSSVLQLVSQGSGRDVGIRELLKFCQRIEDLLPGSYEAMDVDDDHNHVTSFSEIFPNSSYREDMFIEARDVFFGAGASTATSRAISKAIAETVGEKLGLDAERQQWVLKDKVPEFNVEKDANGRTMAVRLGRTRIPARLVSGGALEGSARPFAMHKPAVLLLSRIGNAISHKEPVLLTGETGTGKTSVVSHLAHLLNRSLISLNLSHQTESSDLIGGLKPIDARVPGSALQEKFVALFSATFSRRKNEKFDVEVRKAVGEGKWKRAVGLWKESVRLAMERIQAREKGQERAADAQELDTTAPRKRRKTVHAEPKSSEHDWATFLKEVEDFEVQHVHGKGKFAFGFVEGPLVKALRSGDWVLLDEVNLASPETLECISGLLSGPTASITLTEHGSLEPVPRHPDFRLFACMNPATDVGKKDLPPPIRSRFTEIDVPPPDADKETLLSIITQYVGHIAVGDKRIIMDIAEFYVAVKQIAESRQIADGANHRPHFSMRTLVRALTYAADTAASYSLRRAVWEGCLMAFTMVLDANSAKLVTALAHKHLLASVRNTKSLLAKDPAMPSDGSYAKFGPFYLEQGPLEPNPCDDYIMTPSVEQKLIDLARIILTRRFPVLIEGPTSSGKTSSVEYLAKRTGHHFVRINNHEHTDIQEYIGSYVSDPQTGKLVFKDGLLVQALRKGHWIVLDELNLAPTDVLEALNRLLDDNRELVIPETHEVVRPHPHFMLFATQNPPGLYAGRKILSRAFRNRFLEVHFDDVPQTELETILCQRCQIAPSYGKKIVAVFHELQKRRQTSRVFESKQGFATLRDLFRWAGRDAIDYQELANNGYMLLAERARRPEDKLVVKEVIEAQIGKKIDEDALYDLFRPDIDIQALLGQSLPTSSSIIWTKAMQRLYTLVSRGLKYNEPILLVGETGSGKTSVCQVFTEASGQQLLALNCHQNTETADLIGGLRPVRNRGTMQAELFQEASQLLSEMGLETPSTVEGLSSMLSSIQKGNASLTDDHRARLEKAQSQLSRLHSIFEWQDGPLIEAMHRGDLFLLDEISLADDSVLERLNSVLEPARSIVLAERGGTDSSNPVIYASQEFKLIATMNPGGDYGKKELSPALRNRFTEIWVPHVDDRHDLELIVSSMWCDASLRHYTSLVLDFVEWLCAKVEDRSLLGLRDILAWVMFTNSTFNPRGKERISADELFHHAAHMTYLDGLSSLPQMAGFSQDALIALKTDAMKKLDELVPLALPLGSNPPAHDHMTCVQLGSFAVDKGSGTPAPHAFNFVAPTTLSNASRVVRACQVTKPILLEGSPGVGKTSLITALANLSGHKLCRINLSDQTDIIDLFGSDLPVEGGSAGQFAWKDAEFLTALQEGQWVLLDEMNLAPQAVLEGLNAILDHRGEVYIPEISRTFKRHPSFRIFAAQNPLHQGGGRKGLPKSFVNRFTKVYVDELTPDDLHIVCRHIFPDVDEDVLRRMVSFNLALNNAVNTHHDFAQNGSPWEFNLRDVIRWGTLCSSSGSSGRPDVYLRSVYLHRFRSVEDRRRASSLFEKAFDTTLRSTEEAPPWTVAPSTVQYGHFICSRTNLVSKMHSPRMLKSQLSAIEAVGDCVSQSWLAILTGPKNSGKTEVVRTLAHFTGSTLKEISVNSSTDTMDILGSFEQVDARRRLLTILADVRMLIEADLRSIEGSRIAQDFLQQIDHAQGLVQTTPFHDLSVISTSMESFLSMLVSTYPASGTRYMDLLARLQSMSTSGAGQFEWVDGPLVQAMKCGDWLLLDGANLCGPSVLDRLNSLCEIGGSLILSERGFVNGEIQRVDPHPNFRLFMSVDPQHGELSRAMRNRGIEISLLPTLIADDSHILRDSTWLPSFPISSEQSIGTQLTHFESLKRGLLAGKQVVGIVPSSTGRSLDQDSALSGLLDHAPHLLAKSSPSHTPNETPWIQFLSRNLSPGYMPYICRFFSHAGNSENCPQLIRDFINQFPPKTLTTALIPFKKSLEERRPIPPTYIDSLPTYFYWQDTSLFNGKLTAEGLSVTQLAVLEAIRLAANQFIGGRSDRLDFDIVLSKEKQIAIRAAIYEILQDVDNVGNQALAQASPTSDAVNSLRLAANVQELSGDLVRAVNTSAFDFSALHAISGALADLLKGVFSSFEALHEHTRKLQSLIALSKGRGLFSLWTQLYLDDAPEDFQHEITKVDDLLRSLPATSSSAALSHQAFNLMCLKLLPSALGKDNKIDLADLQLRLENYLMSNANERLANDPGPIHPCFVVIELYWNLSSSVQDGAQDPSKILRHIVDLSFRAGAQSLGRLVPYQHVVWTLDAGKGLPSLATRAQLSYLEAVWNSQVVADISGPSLLFHPIIAHGAVLACNMDQVPLSRLAHHEAVLRDHARLQVLQSEQTADRLSQLATFLYQSLAILASCFASSFETDVYTKIQVFVSDASSKLHTGIADFVALLMKSSDDAFRSAIQEEILPSMGQFANQDQAQRLSIFWVCFSRVLFKLIIPDTPIDPARVQASTSTRIRSQETSIAVQLMLQRQLEALLTGADDNDITQYLAIQLAELRAVSSGLPDVPSRDDVARLHLYWSEVEQFQHNVVSPARLDALVTALLLEEASAHPREQVAQESLQGFYQRLDSVYPEFADISLLLKFAVLHLRFGLRMLAETSSTDRRDPSLAHLANTILAYPSLNSASKVLEGFHQVGPTGTGAFRHILLILGGTALERSIGVRSPQQILSVDLLYDQAIGLWLIDRAKEKKMNAEASTLYRKVDHNAVDDSEIEEHEFLALFPTFEDALEKETNLPDAVDNHVRLLVPAVDMAALMNLHYELWHPSSPPVDSAHTFSQLRSTAFEQVISDSVQILPESVDDIGVPFSLRLLDTNISHLGSLPSVSKASYNFYADPNYAELRRAAAVLNTFLDRLQTISREWPDQMVLQHLIERCSTILETRCNSPVAKVLAMLEQLLVQSEDWQMYANRDNSVKANQDEIVRLIVDWRRLELSCWQSLLDSQATTFVQDLPDWWFRLYDALVRGPLNASQMDAEGSGELDKYIDTLIPLLDDFVTSSPHGQFAPRMRLLQSFASYISALSPHKAPLESSVLDRVCRIIHSTLSYYGLFSELLAKSLAEQKALLERDIKAFIKLASWKDVNVQALKQSAERTHRQLYKVMKKFRDVLKQPISARLQPQMAGDIEGQPLPLASAPKPSNSASFVPSLRSPDEHHTLPAYMINLPGTFAKFATLLNDRVRPFVASRSAHSLDDLSVEIITTSKRLASIALPSSESTEAKEKHIKALVVRKRKAWSDLLKELKQAGLASNLKPEVLRQNGSEKWIREQPSITDDSLPSVEITRSEVYFVKLCGTLPSLRTSLSSHHPDLTTRELQRGHMFLESGFSLAVDLRSRLASSLRIHDRLSKIVSRLQTLTLSPGVIHHGENVVLHVSSVKDLLSKASHSLVELMDNARVLDRVKSETQIPDTFFTKVANMIDETNVQLAAVRMVHDCLQGHPIQCLTQEEYNHLESAGRYLGTLPSTLTSWISAYAQLGYLLRPLHTWFLGQHVIPFTPTQMPTASPETGSEKVLNSLLVTVQSLVSRCPEASKEKSDEEEEEKYILKGYQSARELTNVLNLSNVASDIDRFLTETSSHPDFRTISGNLTPFLTEYLSLVEGQLTMHANWMKTLFKFNFIMCSLLQTLSQQGFCKPDEGGDGGEGATKDASGGTGIGEGSGTENISKEIEDESQVEGLKGEDGQQNEKEDRHEDGDAIEMDNDFGGELEDVPGSDDEEQEGQSDGEDEPEFDETLGDLDQLDPGTVDEKMWGDEKGPEDSKSSDEKADQDHSKEQDGPSEMTAKESKDDAKKKDKAEQSEKEGEPGDEGAEEMPEETEGEEDGQEGEDDSNPDVNGNKMEEHVPEANTLDLPDDMDLQDDGADKDVDGGVDDDMDMGEDDAMEDDKMSEDWNKNDDGDGAPEAADDESANNPDSTMEPQEIPDTLPVDQDTTDDAQKEDEEAVQEDSIAQPDLSNQGGTMDPDDVVQPEKGDGTSAGDGGTSKGQGVDPDTSDETKPMDESRDEADSTAQPQPLDNSGEGAATSGTQQGQSATWNENQTVPNPLRSLGDALKEIRQRFDEILNQDTESAPRPKQAGEADNQGQIEYLQPDDEDDTQALGPAGEEQVAKLNQLTIIDQDVTAEESSLPQEMDGVQDTEMHEQPAEKANKLTPNDAPAEELRPDLEGAILRGDSATQPSDERHGLPVQDEVMEELSENAELQLSEWRASDYPESGAEHLWRVYVSLTHDLAYTLCEQLRLILEPTMATRLKGDYRTGKRLNMKKVISYIASDYTKDKIWLRRTKPSQREYQILLSIDDSRSMAESHSIHLAYQTLALISKALGRLESGDIAIAKFGETFDLLHGFDLPLTDQAGSKVLNAFRFAQKATNVLSLLETSLKVLEKARERKAMSSATATDLWQLQIIISDGICQDHERLRTVLRKAEEQRVMVVFIVLDSLQSAKAEPGNRADPSHGSILNLAQAVVRTVDGRMELETKKYLDTFPFEYYVILRQVEALPEVLAGTLKQFFERISEE